MESVTMRRILPLLMAAVALSAPSLQAQVSVTADVAVKSRYLFAGMVFWKGPMTQPKLTLSTTSGNGTLTVNGGAVYMHGDYNELMELDVWGDYYHQLSDQIGAYVGAGYYNFKHFLVEDEYAGSPELYGGLVLYVPLTPSVYIAKDFDLTEGTHVTFSLSHPVALAENGTSLTFTGNLDYNHEYYRPDSGFSYADLTATLALPLGPLTVSPMVAVQAAIADDGYFGDWGIFGISASMGF
jgi:hypothetical protein